MKKILFVITVLLSIVSICLAERYEIYDDSWDKTYNTEDNKVYDDNYRLKYRIEGDKIYDDNYRLKYRIKKK